MSESQLVLLNSQESFVPYVCGSASEERNVVKGSNKKSFVIFCGSAGIEVEHARGDYC